MRISNGGPEVFFQLRISQITQRNHRMNAVTSKLWFGGAELSDLLTTSAYIQGGPERMQHLRSLISKKSKISDFDEGVLILEPFFWSNVIFQICFFVSRVTIEVMRNFFECLPRIVTLQNYVMNASLYSCCLRFTKQEQTLYLGEPNNGHFGTSTVTFETEVANFENDIASEKQS